MDKWKEFREFINDVVDECSKETELRLLFKSKPTDRTGDMIKGEKYYAHANLKTSDVDKFVACVERLANDREVLIRTGKSDYTTIYYPLGTDEAKRIMRTSIFITDIEEAEEFFGEKGWL